MDQAAKKHLTQWKHNRRFIQGIDAEFPDWIVTASFYTALHVIDALLSHDRNKGIVSHNARNSVLARTNRYQKIYRLYHPLYNLSRTIRYLAEPGKWVPSDEIEPQVFGRWLYPIEKSAHKLMMQSYDAPPLTLGGKQSPSA